MQEEFYKKTAIKGGRYLKQRSILVATIGYIIGILWGLYFKFSIVPFYIILFVTYCIIKIFKNNKKHKFKLLSIYRYSRYLKLNLNLKVILILIIFSIISNIIVISKNNQYETNYKDEQEIEFIGIVISKKVEKQYYNQYKVKILNSDFNIYIQVGKNQNELEYGDEIQVKGQYQKPLGQRNYKGYDDSRYLKTLKIIGRVRVNYINLLGKEKLNPILQMANKINLKLEEKIDKTFNSRNSAILKGLLLGDKNDIDENIKEQFQIANMSHILAISGMHIRIYCNWNKFII